MTPEVQRSVNRIGVLETYRDWLPITDKTPKLTLGEGNTPLLYSKQLSDRVHANVYLKYEGLNPTGSFKDRGMVMAVAKAVEEGAGALICASTGNTSASAAAYAARAGLKAIILIPDGYVAMGKLAQAMQYGAAILSIKGNFDDALGMVRDLATRLPVAMVNSVNPFRLEGQKTAAFEVCDALERAPDLLCIPVGNAGNISAYWKGFSEYFESGLIPSRPKMHGFQAAGAAPLVAGHDIYNPETFATAIRIGKPASAHLARTSVRESGGGIGAVSDDQIAEAYRLIAREGIFAEPGSAASVAGLLHLHDMGALQDSDTIVCVLTGNGLKDPDNAVRLADSRPQLIEGGVHAVEKALESYL